MRPLLLVIRTGKREFREHLLESIAQPYRIHMFVVADPTWETAYLDGYTRIDTADVQAMISAAKDLQADEHISGVLCWDESRVVQAAEVAAALGLPGDPAAIARCRDTSLMRQALAAAGVPQPACVKVPTLPDALVAAGRMGYPVRIGGVKVDTAEELSQAFDYGGSLLLEEHLAGYDVSVDVAVHSGEIFPLCLARKEEGDRYFVHAADPLLHDPVLMRLLHDTHRALGFRDGVTHTRLRVTSEGPKVTGINGNLGGDMIPRLGFLATGVDAGLAAAAVASGRAPIVEHDRQLVAGIRFFHEGESFPDNGVAHTPLTADRQGRIGFVIAVAATEPECRATLSLPG
jgi:hypothetical protein